MLISWLVLLFFSHIGSDLEADVLWTCGRRRSRGDWLDRGTGP